MDDARALIGRWTLRRRLVDRRAAQSGVAHGTLTVACDGEALSWHEEAVLHWAGHTMPVTRDLRLEVLDGQWWTTFTDHRPFHPWELDEEVVHPCVADVYRGRLRMTDSTLRVLWDVTGPSKEQRIITTHRRQPATPAGD
jgi:Family of unknown function (DUF6314)